MLDDDLDVLIECVEESEQTFGRELPQPAAQDSRRLELVDFQNRSDFGLSQSFGLDDFHQSLSQPRFQQCLRGLFVTEIGEHVAAARGDDRFPINGVSPDACRHSEWSSRASLRRLRIKSNTGLGVAMPVLDFFEEAWSTYTASAN